MDWFGSEYYLKLYRNRNYTEAKSFIDTLLDYLKIEKSSNVVDVCCGRGRHSIHLATKGLFVTGIDLADESIAFAKQYECKNLKFNKTNILNEFGSDQYDLALNLFTSFGYFDNDSDSEKSLLNIAKSLKKGGAFVIDYLNEKTVVKNLVSSENQLIEGLDFNIKRFADDRFIRKTIEVIDAEKKFEFSEQVRRFTLSDFTKMLNNVGLEIVNVFGNYELSLFNENESPRLIIHTIKI